MGPQAGRLMRHAVHREGVEADLFFHDEEALDTPWNSLLFARSNARLRAEIVAFALV
jgi:hypothetical protein